MAIHISDARAAINERLNSLLEIASLEHEALDAAVTLGTETRKVR
jgi:hypothetical protein